MILPNAYEYASTANKGKKSILNMKAMIDKTDAIKQNNENCKSILLYGKPGLTNDKILATIANTLAPSMK